jgi:hypothetical protein
VEYHRQIDRRLSADDISLQVETALGKYNPFGCIIEEFKSAELFNDAMTYFFESEVRGGKTVFTTPRINKTRIPIGSTSLREYLHCLLAWQHERAHFYQIASSPLGVFFFRSTICKYGMIQRLFLNMRETHWIRSGNAIYVPLPMWFQWLSEHLPGDEITQAVRDIVMCWNSSNILEATMFLDRITDVMDAIDDVRRLQDITSGMLNRYFGVDSSREAPPIITHLSKDSACDPTPCCTTLKIIEAYARLIEFKFLGALQIESEMNDSILNELLAPKYTGVLDYVMWLYDDAEPDTIAGILDLSLFTPADTLFSGFWLNELQWEDIHPGYRLRRIASIAKEKSLQVRHGRYLDFYDVVSWVGPLRAICSRRWAALRLLTVPSMRQLVFLAMWPKETESEGVVQKHTCLNYSRGYLD